jgi:hypothetical protein
MRFAWRVASLSIACGLSWALATAALDAQPQAPPADQPPPSAIGEALVEHGCGAMHPPGTLETGAYLDCRRNRLLYLRTEFGRDLRRLSAAERRAIDTACRDLRASRGQDAYVGCLTTQLASLPGHGKTKPDTVGGDAVLPVPPPVSPPPVAPASSRLSGVWIGAALIVLIAGGAGALFVRTRTRRAVGACRTCGAALAERGDLCQKCRHEAAETLRRASTERADQVRAEEDAKRREAERESEQQQRAREDTARRRELDAAHAAQAREREEDAQRRREDDAWRQRQIDATAASDEFDAHAVLEVPRDASAAAIEAAYQAARAKYDLELVADLGVELQDHYKRKGQAVQRAYEILAAERQG